MVLFNSIYLSTIFINKYKLKYKIKYLAYGDCGKN